MSLLLMDTGSFSKNHQLRVNSLAPARLDLRAVLRTVYPAPSQVHVVPAPSILVDGEERMKSPARPLNFKRDFLGVVGSLNSPDD